MNLSGGFLLSTMDSSKSVTKHPTSHQAGWKENAKFSLFEWTDFGFMQRMFFLDKRHQIQFLFYNFLDNICTQISAQK